ncbi:MAG: AAA ATPase midasin [Pleopsidium flavum]|nr:MAG: AAA ATPase midasin [Pleopsidium flavum]
MDCSWADLQLCSRQTSIPELPRELLELVQHGSNTEYLDALAFAALNPRYTKTVFTYYEPIFVDLCGRWLSSTQVSAQSLAITSALARILPWASHLAVFAEELILKRRAGVFEQLSSRTSMELQNLSDRTLLGLLLTVFRLLLFDNHTFAQAIAPWQLQCLLRRENRCIRYLAIRILCLYLYAADAAMIRMVGQYLGEEAIEGEWEERTIDYGFLSLWEEKRVEDFEKQLRKIRGERHHAMTYCVSRRIIRPNDLMPLTAEVAGILLPRIHGSAIKPSSIISTNTTCLNLGCLAKALLEPCPILVTGLAGSGKTALILEVGRELNTAASMITVHLNEQTDAKLLIGMYTTGSTPGSFVWRPGVLTQAVKEGRWVLIEDIDRAPTEVLSVILPLIEHRELLIPNRCERVHAARGFKLIATMRTTLNGQGIESLPRPNMLGNRLWRQVPLQPLDNHEIGNIIGQSFPLLHVYLPTIKAVYSRIQTLYHDSSLVVRNKALLGRPLNHRDIFKWCQRLHQLLTGAGLVTGDEAISEDVGDSIFMEAVDCFAGGLQSGLGRVAVVSCIAQELHVSPQRVQYCLYARVPNYLNNEVALRIGRITLPKRKLHTAVRTQTKHLRTRPFALTSHALRLLEQVAAAVRLAEPVLLVGETGTGKTTIVQQLADSLGHKVTVVNLSQQSESGDLLGGFKPVSVRTLALPMKEEFDDLFDSTFSTKKNKQYLEMLGRRVAKGQWSRAVILWREALRMVQDAFGPLLESGPISSARSGDQVKKRRKLDSRRHESIKARWVTFASKLETLSLQISGGPKSFAFSFIEGNIVKAARKGDWVLLDEVNLASPHTLESIADLLQSGPGTGPSLFLSEAGMVERVQVHPSFRIFGAMNPATDVGKKDLPPGLRSRFTELYVQSPDKDLTNLLDVVKAYLGSLNTLDERAAHDISRLYLEAKRLADNNHLVDGADQRPHFSLRTLTRTLSYVTDIASTYGLRRAIYEGFSMSFLTLLSGESERLLMPLIEKYILGNHRNARSLLNQTPRLPSKDREYVQFNHYWIRKGQLAVENQPQYIITPFIERNMLNLVRATSTRRFPVLIQGPTSSGKTSMIEYLAKISGNKYVRINNHEHTDLQEYVGTYVSGIDGQLTFQEGILVQALREGHWIVLDELNLAPTDVLEALNRLLDDNRELLIPETQEVVQPHPDFMLFATQNPAGLYGGRKALSRAFRNRFLELHFDDIPEDELETILRERSQIAPSFCARIVAVYKKLSFLRQSSRLFEQRNSFATLRDLFRWALRKADDREQLAVNGFMLLAERVRKPEERSAVKGVIEEVMKVTIDEVALYGPSQLFQIGQSVPSPPRNAVVWTKAMCRLYTLVSKALENNEPILLVGETGCGKTTIAQVMAEASGKELHIVNAHQNTETGDLIGAQRPIRNRAAIEIQLRDDLAALLAAQPGLVISSKDDVNMLLKAYDRSAASDVGGCSAELKDRVKANRIKYTALFEWCDGSLVHAMRTGQHFLLDEISLADDSVLERLNSVLEPQRSLLLAEKGPEEAMVQASEGFQFIATMNPGGDYGKRELSPALRNRFTEIWVPSSSDVQDILQIVQAKLKPQFVRFSEAIVRFAEWFGNQYNFSGTSSISIRDVLAWIDFINAWLVPDLYLAVLNGAAMVYIDTLGANPAAKLAISPGRINQERGKCLEKLSELLGRDVAILYQETPHVRIDQHHVSIGSFSVERADGAAEDPSFSLRALTTQINAMRILRALQLSKPILLEGNPGVGKTTLVLSLAQVIGKSLTRINLSEQTDLMDLFGSDVPVEGAEAGHFAWRDAPFLQAMQKGEWVLLDEMNLASQSVLEGLNACFDHRGEIYISELDQTFSRHPNFVVFAAQNPHHQGGGRKGLPASFVNRFTVVYADVLKSDDLMLICTQNFPEISTVTIEKLICYVMALEHEITHHRRFGSQGGPWEFNLRDLLRWLQLLESHDSLIPVGSPADFIDLIFRQRFRTQEDKERVTSLFELQSGQNLMERNYFHNISPNFLQVGLGYLTRNTLVQHTPNPNVQLSKLQLPILESLMTCVQRSWPCIIVGSSGCGKSALIKQLAAYNGAQLVEFAVHSDIDTMDLVGGYEQIDPQRQVLAFLELLEEYIRTQVLEDFATGAVPVQALFILDYLHRDGISIIDMEGIYEQLRILSSNHSTVEMSRLTRECEGLLSQPAAIDKARFEWIDGVLIQALEQGKWLVLDNANLCSASVLDRLNSLLEPNGALLINEHHTPDGTAKLVKPHPNFRMFLTMDPRHGELSRAMRNRCVEIYVPSGAHSPFRDAVGASYAFTCESSIARLRNLRALDWGSSPITLSSRITEICLDHLSISDMKLLSRMHSQASANLLSDLQNAQTVISSALERYLKLPTSKGLWNHGLMTFYEALARGSQLGEDFRDAQSIHPLVNPLLLSKYANMVLNTDPYWLAALQEFILVVASQGQDLSSTQRKAELKKPSQMTRLERSYSSIRVQSLSKDSTSAVSYFLDMLGKAFWSWAEEQLQPPLALKDVISSIFEVLYYWRDIYDLSQSPTFDENVFQAYLILGRTMLSDAFTKEGSLARLYQKVGDGLDLFNASWQLSTGLSMEIMWKACRPETPPTLPQLLASLKMEELADRFDTTLWRSHIPVGQLNSIRGSIASALSVIRSQNAQSEKLIGSVTTAIADIEVQYRTEDVSNTPYFQDEFEGMSQHCDLVDPLLYSETANAALNLNPLVHLLAGRPTKLLPFGESRPSTSALLSSLKTFAGKSGTTTGWMGLRGTTPIGLLQKINNAGTVKLRLLDLFQTELDVIGSSIASKTARLTLDQLELLNKQLCRLLCVIFKAHDIYFEKDFLDGVLLILDLLQHPSQNFSIHATNFAQLALAEIFKTDLAETHFFRSITAQFLIPSVFNLIHGMSNETTRYLKSAAAWSYFSIGCLLLYIPDRPFDPAVKPIVERQRHNKRKAELKVNLEALKRFENMFTGQSTNLRSRLVERHLLSLGKEPQVPAIPRPTLPDLKQLQGEFNNLLKTVVGSCRAEGHISQLIEGDGGTGPEANILRTNISQVMSRLENGFRVYEDLTAPAVGMLQCLDIGLSLAMLEDSTSDDASTTALHLADRTPFMGGSLHSLLQVEAKHINGGSDLCDLRLSYLESLAVAQGIDRTTLSCYTERQIVYHIFHSFYEGWKDQLGADQQREAARTGLYRYRGAEDVSNEEDEEDFREMFPNYDGYEAMIEPVRAGPLGDPRKLASNVALQHAALFRSDGAGSDQLQALLAGAGERIGKLAFDMKLKKAPISADKLLAPILISLDQAQARLSLSIKAGARYNFYADANLGEAKKILLLVHDIKARFRHLIEAWPEHATLHDVVKACDELLEFQHVEPVAKFLTKAEKLHSFIYEWQIVASREFSAANVYDDLTRLLISWRRLELSTWSRLFDLEDEKCNEDARSWWFVAYEVIIAVPLSSEGSQDLSKHAEHLLATLENFLSATTIGQYSQRLRIVEDFRELTGLLAKDISSMQCIHGSIANFYSFFKRFEDTAKEALHRGRRSLEKDMKEVILLASWKDTNINALKDSARRSHHRLFKLVRKYRALLGQSTESLLKQGLPDGEVRQARAPTTIHSLSVAPVDPEALVACDAHLEGWSARPSRLTNTTSTVKNMERQTQIFSPPGNEPAYLSSFVSDLIESMSSLRKQTPSTLSKDNKETVKYLKSQKRKLFADTLKEVRQMGFRSNLSTDALDRQACLSAVLARSPLLREMEKVKELKDAEDYLYKTLDIMPQVRSASQDHSDELGASEITRSIGYLEGILSHLMKQREMLALFSTDMFAFDGTVEKMQNLWIPHQYAIQGKGNAFSDSSRRLHKVILWLPSIIEVGCNIIRSQNKLGQTDSSTVIEGLLASKSNFVDHIAVWDRLPIVPPGLSTSTHTAWHHEVTRSLQQLNHDLGFWSRKYPLIAFVFKQIDLWTDDDQPQANGHVNGELAIHITDLDQGLSKALDTILVALQRMRKSAAGMPSSTGDTAWLAKFDARLAAAIKALRCERIILTLEGLMLQCQGLDLRELPVATALFRMALPIVQQYRNILFDVFIRYAELHRSTCRLAYVLAKSFAQIASQGFCTPAERSGAQDGRTEKLEDGTGLGEGEGAEDISKDIQEDENLCELAQQHEDKGNEEEIENEKDAVDMQQDDMEGEMGDVSEKGDDDEGDSNSKEGGDDLDEEAGAVDDLDPSAVDEKLWDGDGEEAEKSKEGDSSKGKNQKNEKAAAEESKKDGALEGEGEEEEEEREDKHNAVSDEGSDEAEKIGREQLEKTDAGIPEGDTLDLPEEMDMDNDKASDAEVDSDDDRMNELSDVEQAGVEEEQVDNIDDDENSGVSGQEDPDHDVELDVRNIDEDKPGQGENSEDTEPTPEADGDEDVASDREGHMSKRVDDAAVDITDAAPSDVQGLGDDGNQQAGDEEVPSLNAQTHQGSKGNSISIEQLEAAAEEGQLSQTDQAPVVGHGQPEQLHDSQEISAFKKLGDALERWHRQQHQIREASRTDESQEARPEEVDADDMEFEHLPDNAVHADAQALGAATEDQAQALDQSRGLDSQDRKLPQDLSPEDYEAEQQDVDMSDFEAQAPRVAQPTEQTNAGTPGGRDGENGEHTPEGNAHEGQREEDLKDVDKHLSNVRLEHTSPLAGRSPEEARRLWSHYENLTRDLSLSLTEQLRLILAPTLATKMRGDFRTGKRLNIKRIIPYIASQYKRDKIWMRRSVPSKRNYQIMLAVDDSKSMGESGSGQLAFETLALVSKSLSMLEVGQICIVGFGEDVRVAQEFDNPFSSEAGVHVFQQFSFHQTKTNVRKLVAESIDLFREARNKTFTAGADLWQLELIISDGVCEDHDTIRRLVRQAQEERIMIVFVIVDALRGSSIMDMTQATFEPDESGEMKLKMKRYLDGFPFGYYLVVGDVRELPGVLATALRQWFAEVVDAAG